MADETDFDNLDIDIANIGKFANDPAGDVAPRIGATYPNLRKIINQIAYNNRFMANTWAELALIVGVVDKAVAEVNPSDAGTHTDPVVGGTVNNSGIFQWNAATPGWKRIADVTAPTLASTTDTTSTNKAASPANVARQVGAPIWAGKVNGWPDPFFRRLDLTSQILAGRDRWFQNSGASFAGWARVSNSEFKGGKALRRTAGYNQTTMSGPYIWLDEIDAVPGDTITAYLLIKDPAAGGGTVYAVGQFSSSNDTVLNGSAIVLSNAAGNQSGIIADATSKWLRLSVTVPAGAEGLRLYPYNISGATGFDVVACWAFKGAPADGPEWPSQQDNYFAVRDVEIESRLAAVEVSSSPYIAYQHPLGDGEMVGDSTYSAKVIGFYEQLTTKTIFNVAQMRVWASNATTAVEWKAFIRDTAAAFNPSVETPLASGTVAGGSFPIVDSLYSHFFASKNTAQAGKYFFIMFRAVDDTNMNMKRWLYNAAITPARHGFPIGTSAGWNQAWVLSGPTIGYGQPTFKLLSQSEENKALAARVASNEAAIAILAPKPLPFFTIPANIKATVGTELNLYYDSIFSALSDGLNGIKGYSVSVLAVTGSKGLNKRRCFRFTPVSGDIGTHNFVATARDAANNIVATRSFSITVVAATAKASAKNILLMGDSLMGAGVIPVTVQAKFAALSGGVVPTFVGTQGTAPAKHDGFGGYQFSTFATDAPDFYRVTVSGVTAANIGTTYTIGGVTYTIKEVNVTLGSGTILLSGASAPAASGTLTKTGTGGGDATIAYSAMSTVEGNPHWFGGIVDYNAYRVANSIAAVIDAIVEELGVNDAYNNVPPATSINYAKVNMTAALADNPACKFIIELPSLCGNTNDGFAANYGSGGPSREEYEARIFALRAAIIAAFDAGAYNANVIVGSAGLQIDRYYGYTTASVVSAARIATMVDEHTNGVHPNNAGYQQNGDAIFAELMAYL